MALGILWFLVWAGCLGLIFGSFLNLVIVRLPAHESIIEPRSHCRSCQHQLGMLDLIPVVSFMLTRGRCRYCAVKLPLEFVVIELLTSLLLITFARREGPTMAFLLRDAPFALLLIAITFIDLKHRIIPDVLSLGGTVLGIGSSFLTQRLYPLTVYESVGGAVLGFTLFFLLAVGYERVAHRQGLGGGDVKLLAMLGAFIGIKGLLSTILISALAGSLCGFIMWLGERAPTRSFLQQSIPYGPFLVLGALCTYLYGGDVWFRFMILM